MNSRQHRAAFEAKRTLPDLTDEQCIAMDADRERQKYDPLVQQQRLHDDIEFQQRMLHAMGRDL